MDSAETADLLNFIKMVNDDIRITMSYPTRKRVQNKRKVNHKKYLQRQLKRCAAVATMQPNGQNELLQVPKSDCEKFWTSNSVQSCSTDYWECGSQLPIITDQFQNRTSEYYHQFHPTSGNQNVYFATDSIHSPASSSQESVESCDFASTSYFVQGHAREVPEIASSDRHSTVDWNNACGSADSVYERENSELFDQTHRNHLSDRNLDNQNVNSNLNVTQWRSNCVEDAIPYQLCDHRSDCCVPDDCLF